MRKPYSAKRVAVVTGYEDVLPDLVRRMLVVLALLAFIILVLWADRGGLRDNAHPGRPLTLVDVFYFTVVTVTTVGYGDIAPVTQRARLVSTAVVTPVRIVILVLFIGTAYELAVQRYREAYQMRRIRRRLAGHIILCGYGVKGHATVGELLSFGCSPDDIVVIEADADAAEEAARQGLTAFRGDATSEAALKAAVIDKARHVIVDVDRDDTTVLICLTAKHLNPGIHVVAAAKEAENVPLIYRSGADVVVAPPVAGGRMLAIATHLEHAPRFLDDILTFGRGLDLGERAITAAEAGRTAAQLPDLAGMLVLGAYHQGRQYNFDQLHDLRLEAGDVLITLCAKG